MHSTAAMKSTGRSSHVSRQLSATYRWAHYVEVPFTPLCLSINMCGTPCDASSTEVVSPTRLPPTTRTGTSCSNTGVPSSRALVMPVIPCPSAALVRRGSRDSADNAHSSPIRLQHAHQSRQAGVGIVGMACGTAARWPPRVRRTGWQAKANSAKSCRARIPPTKRKRRFQEARTVPPCFSVASDDPLSSWILILPCRYSRGDRTEN